MAAWYLVFLLILVPMIIARRQARAAARGPAPGVAPVSEPELRARLAAMAGDNGPIAVRDEGPAIVVTWQLMGIPWATHLFRAKLRETHALHLTIDGTKVVARLRVGKVAWETAAATWMPRAIVTWKTRRFVRFGKPTVARALVEGEPRTAALLVAHVRDVVTAAGYAFEPTLRRSTRA